MYQTIGHLPFFGNPWKDSPLHLCEEALQPIMQQKLPPGISIQLLCGCAAKGKGDECLRLRLFVLLQLQSIKMTD